MRFWFVAPLFYLGTLAVGLVIPATLVLMHHPSGLRVATMYTLTALVLGLAAAILALMVAKVLFPNFWWLGQVMGQDVYELQGVYFVGLRLSRVPVRLQRLVFGAGEKFRRWDVAFGLIWLLLIGMHGLGAAQSRHWIESLMPRPVRLPETLHEAFLSDLPVMRALHQPWSPDPALEKKLLDQAERIQQVRGKSEADWFALAQLHLLRAYKVRRGAGDAYTFTPMDTTYFERGIGAQSADYLNQILSIPEAKRAPITRGTLTLLGFFYLCEYNDRKAEPPLQQALAQANAPDDSGIPLDWTRLIAAQVALQKGNGEEAEPLLLAIVSRTDAPPPLMALAIEHLAEAKRLEGESADVPLLLDKAAALYAAAGDGGGEARVHLRRAVWLSDQGESRSATEELSQASSKAEAAGDVFALNTVVRVTHLLPALR
jgi:hypothetical protein